MNKNGRCAAIIGGGLGGLAVALRLSVRGWRVVLCEKNDHVGGKMNRYVQQGLRFDTGPSLITMPWVFEELFQDSGTSLHDYLKLLPVQPLGDYFFSDGTRLRYTATLPHWIDTLTQISPSDTTGFLKYMHLGARLYQLSASTFLRRPITDPPDKHVLKALWGIPIKHAWGNYHKTVENHFHDKRLQQLFDRYPTFVGSSPYAVPATLTLIPYLEYALGGFHIQGGLYRLIETLEKRALEKGVEIRTHSEVVAIHHRTGRCTGVETNAGDEIPANVIVMNGDHSLASRLLGKTDQTLPTKDHSLSGFLLLLAVKRNSLDLVHHNVFFSSNYREEFDDLCEKLVFPSDPTVYICAPARTDPTMATDEYEPLFVMANAPPRTELWDDTYTAKARNAVFQRLRRSGQGDIESCIVSERVITPRDIAIRDNATGGAIYGQNAHGWRKAFFRPPNKDPKIKGLYYVGGTVHPGGGTPIVLLSARIVTELIGRYENR